MSAQVNGNCEQAYETRVYQDDRRCWRVIRVWSCARLGRLAKANCHSDAYPTLEGADGAVRPEVPDLRSTSWS
jgi:hypothetical protein